MQNVLFDDWESLLRAFISTILAYILLVLFIRVFGKRTLSKMNAFDFIVTVALGSCLAAVALNKSIAVAEGGLVFLTLIFLQFSITWLSVRVPYVKKVVSGEPTMIVYDGAFLQDVMKRERITQEEVKLSAREKGFASLDDIAVMVLETTGDITIISRKQFDDEKVRKLSTLNFSPHQSE